MSDSVIATTSPPRRAPPAIPLPSGETSSARAAGANAARDPAPTSIARRSERLARAGALAVQAVLHGVVIRSILSSTHEPTQTAYALGGGTLSRRSSQVMGSPL